VLLTITTTHAPATDLGYLLHKHPDRVQRFELPFGHAHVFYPEASAERCTAALLVEVDQIDLVRGRKRKRGARGGTPAFALADYVNDRAYVASSFLSVALVSVFKSAMSGACVPRPELAATPIALEAHLPAVPARRGGAELVRRLFEPLGYAVTATPLQLDPAHPDWGESRHVALTLTAQTRLADLLTHLYVLLPVLDDDKHYWVDDAEIGKLKRRGEGWLTDHPERELIVRRYLRHQRRLWHPALTALDEGGPPAQAQAQDDGREEQLEERVSLRDQRLGTVESILTASKARRVLDLGCGPGALLQRLVKSGYDEVVGVDVSLRSLEIAHKRLKLDDLNDERRAKIKLLHSPLTYRDKRLAGYDAAVLVEVIEHFDPPRLQAATHNVFGEARPRTVVVTTPNVEYNVRWESLPGGQLRHPDHRFEWTRAEFREWAQSTAGRHGYDVRFLPIGPEDPEVGAPTQAAVFDQR